MRVKCNLPPALLAEWPGSFTCHCGNIGVERTSNKSQHTVNSGEENFPASPAGIRTRNLSFIQQRTKALVWSALLGIGLFQQRRPELVGSFPVVAEDKLSSVRRQVVIHHHLLPLAIPPEVEMENTCRQRAWSQFIIQQHGTRST